MKRFFFVTILLCTTTIVSYSQNVLLKRDGVSISYDVEYKQSCNADAQGNGQSDLYEYTIYLTNDTDRDVHFVQMAGASVSSYTRSQGKGTCYRGLTPQASTSFPPFLKKNSQMTRTIGIIMQSGKKPPKPQYGLPGFNAK